MSDEKEVPTSAEIDNAAIKWCGQKERETFYDDIVYFRHNWNALPGLKKFVDAEVAIRTNAQERIRVLEEALAHERGFREASEKVCERLKNTLAAETKRACEWEGVHTRQAEQTVRQMHRAEAAEAALAAERIANADHVSKIAWLQQEFVAEREQARRLEAAEAALAAERIANADHVSKIAWLQQEFAAERERARILWASIQGIL